MQTNTNLSYELKTIFHSFDFRLVETLNLMGKHLGAYKMSLECKDENIPFYETLGYKKEDQYFMVIRYKD